MNAAPSDPPRPADGLHPDEISWSGGRWIVYILLAFGLHIGLIYALSDHRPAPPRVVKNAAAIKVVSDRTDDYQLDDPTLFARPHPRGFAAETWLRLPEVTFAQFRWTEPPRLLPLPLEQLGAIFLRLAKTNAAIARETVLLAPAQTTVLPPVDRESAPTYSTLRVSGNLTGRTLRNPPTPLPLQPAQENLTNSVVQVLVDARGQVISAVLTLPGSGSKTVDQSALKIARNTRFNPVPDPNRLTVGKLIFEWQMGPATNAPTTTP